MQAAVDEAEIAHDLAEDDGPDHDNEDEDVNPQAPIPWTPGWWFALPRPPPEESVVAEIDEVSKLMGRHLRRTLIVPCATQNETREIEGVDGDTQPVQQNGGAAGRSQSFVVFCTVVALVDIALLLYRL